MIQKLLPFILLTTLAGCAAQDAPQGRMSVALVTPGPGGTTYELTQGAVLEVRSEAFFESVPLSGNTAAVIISLPVGTYEATLRHPHGFVTAWPLIRHNADGSTTTVMGTLLTPMPVGVTILADDQTSLVLSFRVAASGVITFEGGQLDVSADVAVVAATGAFLHFGADEATVTSATIGAGAPPALASYWPAQGTSGLTLILAGEVSKWEQVSGAKVCAGVALGFPNVSGNAAFADLVDETLTLLGPYPAKVCTYTQGDAHFLEVQLARSGPAQTATLAAQGPGEYIFEAFFAAELPVPIFDGQTLDLSLLDWTHGPLPLRGGIAVTRVTGGDPVLWYQGDLDGVASFAFNPTAE